MSTKALLIALGVAAVTCLLMYAAYASRSYSEDQEFKKDNPCLASGGEWRDPPTGSGPPECVHD